LLHRVRWRDYSFHMYERRFSTWRPWRKRSDHVGILRPGVYVIAWTRDPLAGRKFSWRKDIIYIGMTNAGSGLKGRLNQFDRTMAGKLAHGGADRVRFKHRDYSAFSKRAYVAVASFQCKTTSSASNDLRLMGDVARFEYLCLAQCVDEFGRLPEFNDKKKAPKHSRAT
jgi:hypothetical protein